MQSSSHTIIVAWPLTFKTTRTNTTNMIWNAIKISKRYYSVLYAFYSMYMYLLVYWCLLPFNKSFSIQTSIGLTSYISMEISIFLIWKEQKQCYHKRMSITVESGLTLIIKSIEHPKEFNGSPMSVFFKALFIWKIVFWQTLERPIFNTVWLETLK